MQNMFSNQRKIKLEIENKTKAVRSQNIWKLKHTHF